jgi:hypothetical protein
MFNIDISNWLQQNSCLPLTLNQKISLLRAFLCPVRATAMPYANIDCDITQLIGQSKSGKILKYLDVQAASLMANYLCQIFKYANVTLTAKAVTFWQQ